MWDTYQGTPIRMYITGLSYTVPATTTNHGTVLIITQDQLPMALVSTTTPGPGGVAHLVSAMVGSVSGGIDPGTGDQPVTDMDTVMDTIVDITEDTVEDIMQDEELDTGQVIEPGIDMPAITSIGTEQLELEIQVMFPPKHVLPMPSTDLRPALPTSLTMPILIVTEMCTESKTTATFSKDPKMDNGKTVQGEAASRLIGIIKSGNREAETTTTTTEADILVEDLQPGADVEADD